ncbi:MAG TPA: serine hydrolase domain-containing protein [Gemmatimonadaceae bacterium]|nr:serine hydrolase domain-containing protein [Gemmatimonadaceae bacterium]
MTFPLPEPMMILSSIVPMAFVAWTGAFPQVGQDTADAIVRTPLGMRMDSVMRAADRAGFSGVVLVARNGELLLKKGYGFADRARHVHMTARSVIQIGSNTKDFTMSAILQLIDRGKLGKDDPIAKYFPDVPDDKKEITIWQLMMHRAGFPQHLGEDFDPVTREEEIRHALAVPLLFAPGQDQKYSNVGFSLLAAIIETVSGQRYDEYVRDNLLRPIGLRETGYLLPGFDPARIAHGYNGDVDMGTKLSHGYLKDGPYWNLRGNGGMLSTVSDMYRFYQALFGAKLFSEAVRDLRFRPEEPRFMVGSDLTSFFLYNRAPGARIDLLLASNSTALDARKLSEQLTSVLGLQMAGRPAGGPQRGALAIDTTSGPIRQPAGGTTAESRVELPATPAGLRAQSYLRAFNDADRGLLQAFFRDSLVPSDRTVEQRMQNHDRFRADLGKLVPIAIEESSPLHIVLRAHSDRGPDITIDVTVEEPAPHRVKSLQILMG